MAITVLERALSRPLVVDPKAMSASRDYWALSTNLEEDAGDINDAVALTAPDTYLGLVKKSIKSDPQGGGLWYVSVAYGQLEGGELDGQGGPDNPVPPTEIQLSDRLDNEFSFSTAGGTQHIVSSLETKSYKRNGLAMPAPKFGGAIGVSKDGVTGCDIVVPKFEFTITKRVAFMTMAYVQDLIFCTGRTNLFAWNTFAEREVLFLGADGKYDGDGRSDESWLVTYKFAAGKNEEGIVIVPPFADDGAGGQVAQPSLTVAAKAAWDYLWVGFLETTDATAGVNVQKPAFAYVEKVYQATNFRGVLGF